MIDDTETWMWFWRHSKYKAVSKDDSYLGRMKEYPDFTMHYLTDDLYLNDNLTLVCTLEYRMKELTAFKGRKHILLKTVSFGVRRNNGDLFMSLATVKSKDYPVGFTIDFMISPSTLFEKYDGIENIFSPKLSKPYIKTYKKKFPFLSTELSDDEKETFIEELEDEITIAKLLYV